MNVNLTKEEIYLYGIGKYYRSYEKLGAHFGAFMGKEGTSFVVFAPDVKAVYVCGEWNEWTYKSCPLRHIGSGIWSCFVPYLTQSTSYKYYIETHDGKGFYKADPYAFYAEMRPGTASKSYNLDGFSWDDEAFMKNRADYVEKPMNIYEIHLGSWKRKPDGGFYDYTELADNLVPYIKENGYTHIELLPICEHPLDASWGYQVTGYFAPTSRYGTPHQLMTLINECHKAGIGVIMDWVPSHFCKDAHGLGRFNGSMLYESGEHIQWGTYKFDYSRPQVRSFLISSALYWLDKYHIDGIRVDGVSSMLYLNFCGDEPNRRNRYGGYEDLDAIAFLKEFNSVIHENYKDVFTVAEEASAYPHVTGKEGLGFTYKWNMGWMNDTLEYFSKDCIYRKYHHKLLNFSMMYNYDENFILPLSHDEVVHGKLSLLNRMPGDYWRKFAGLRLLYLFQMTHPAPKLSFMGNELAPFIEWREYESLEWFMLGYDMHRNFSGYIKDLNHLYLNEPALYSMDAVPEGFHWLDADNAEQSIISFERFGKDGSRLIAVLNFTPATYTDYPLKIAIDGEYMEIFNSDAGIYGGSCKVNEKPLISEKGSLKLTIPPLGGTVLKYIEKNILKD